MYGSEKSKPISSQSLGPCRNDNYARQMYHAYVLLGEVLPPPRELVVQVQVQVQVWLWCLSGCVAAERRTPGERHGCT